MKNNRRIIIFLIMLFLLTIFSGVFSYKTSYANEFNTIEWPYNSTCYLEVDYADGYQTQGSAALIGDNIALTAAHCFFRKDGGTDVINQITVVPGKSANYEPYGRAYATKYIYSSEYPYITDEDWCLLVLDRDFPFWYGVKLEHIPNSQIDMGICTLGYPGIYGGLMIRSDGVVLGVSQSNLFFNNYISFGSSGGPILDSESYVVGIVSATSTEYNIGVRITPQLFDIILDTLHEY